MLITMINIPLGLPLRITRKPAKPFAATALSGKGESFPLIGYILICGCSLKEAYSKVSPGRKGGLWALGGFSNSELTSVGSVSYSCSYLFFLLTNRPSEAFLI